MPDAAYRVARGVARELVAEHGLAPPFDLDRLADRFADVVSEDIPTHADVIVLHAPVPGQRGRIVLHRTLDAIPERRRFALAHGLGHVLLGWHPYGTPCDVSTRPTELPVTVHDLVEGEANAFARELLMPAAWIASFDAFDRPAQLVAHVAERAGVAPMPAARAVALQLKPGVVWAVTDSWGRVQDAGRSPGTSICPPRLGEELDAASWARHATERQRADLEGMTISIWRFDERAAAGLPRDRTARGVAADIVADVGLDDGAADRLSARVDGIAGWANEQLGTASLEGMQRVLGERARTVPELAELADHPEFGALMHAKATELVAKRLAR